MTTVHTGIHVHAEPQEQGLARLYASCLVAPWRVSPPFRVLVLTGRSGLPACVNRLA
jgi:hypothetical protein